MIFTQYYLECLSHASYMIADETTARGVVVDPQRDVAQYISDATAQGIVIELVLETHDPMDFAAGHVRGSVNVDLQGRFSEWTGDVLDHAAHIVLVGNPGTELEARIRLGRIGFDQVVGYLDGAHVALAMHPEVTERSSRLTARELETRRRDLPNLQVLDVRNPGEVAIGASVLAARGFADVSDLLGGFEAWKTETTGARTNPPITSEPPRS